MREVHFCTTCDFRLPYCVRTDRRFCGQQCRLWWYRHRGIRRPDFPPGGDRLPTRLKKGQPKTFAQALAALAEARAYAARLEATARKQQTQENKLRNELSDLAHAVTDIRSKARGEQDTLRDALEEEKKRGTDVEQRRQAAAAQVKELREQADRMTERLKQAEDAAVALEETAERQHRDLTDVRATLDRTRQQADDLQKAQARDSDRVAIEIRDLKLERGQLAVQRDTLDRQNAELSSSRDELRRHLDTIEYSLSQRDGELKQQLQNIAAAERAQTDIHAVAESESRSLRAEKERRIAAEQRVEQLTRDLEWMAAERQPASSTDPQTSLIRLRDDLLAAELKEVRLHRDEVIAERELLAARILKLMAPGQYLEHAAAAGYDLTKDPLIRLKREEVLVEHRLALWQEMNQKRRRARRLDREQTIDEQAYAAALSFRWKQIDHPHLRRKQHPKWIAVGFLLDAESERYLLMLTEERIEEMKAKMEQGA